MDNKQQKPTFSEQLEKLAELRDKGHLTESEFTQQKQNLIDAQTQANKLNPPVVSTPMQPKPDKVKAIIGLCLFLLVLFYFFGGGWQHQAKSNVQEIENMVAADAVKQYEIAKRNGNAMDAYTQATFVTAAFLQANDEANYAKWKQIQQQEAAALGLPY